MNARKRNAPPHRVGIGLLALLLPWVTAVAAAPDGPVELRLAGPQQLSIGETPALDLIIVNHSGRELAFVPPLDGSWFHWRYPRLSLRLYDADGREIPLGRGGRCGNMNPITPGQLMTLAPGEQKRVPLSRGYPLPPFTEPGRYSVVLEYDLRAPNRKAWVIEGRASGGNDDPVVAAFLERVPHRYLRTSPYGLVVEPAPPRKQ